MRIISGTARGTKLYTLEGNNTRPTLDRVKESLFNILQEYIAGSDFLDMFAGSGAIGLEAASRGANKVVLCDNSSQACEVIRKNIDKTHLSKKVELYNLNYKIVLENKLQNQVFDIIYIDPPYQTDDGIKALELLTKNTKKRNITKESIIIVETDDTQKYIQYIEKYGYEIKKNKKYGRASLLMLKAKN